VQKPVEWLWQARISLSPEFSGSTSSGSRGKSTKKQYTLLTYGRGLKTSSNVASK
jgi:hypothetical protein